MLTFKYQGSEYPVTPYFYKVWTRGGKVYFGIKYSVHSANPLLFNINYHTSSKNIKKDDIIDFKILRSYAVESVQEYKEVVIYLKKLEARFIRMYKLVQNKQCLNNGVYSDTYVAFSNDKNLTHLQSEWMRDLVSQRMTDFNPMHRVAVRERVRKTLKNMWANKSEAEKAEISKKQADLWANKTDEEKAEFSKKISEGIMRNTSFLERVHNNNPMHDPDKVAQMLRNKMRNSILNIIQDMRDKGVLVGEVPTDKNGWECLQEKYKEIAPKKAYSWKTYKKWVLDYETNYNRI